MSNLSYLLTMKISSVLSRFHSFFKSWILSTPMTFWLLNLYQKIIQKKSWKWERESFLSITHKKSDNKILGHKPSHREEFNFNIDEAKFKKNAIKVNYGIALKRRKQRGTKWVERRKKWEQLKLNSLKENWSI